MKWLTVNCLSYELDTRNCPKHETDYNGTPNMQTGSK